MTRKNIKQYLLQIKQKDGEEVLSNRWQPDILVEIIDQVYDDHEAQLKAKDRRITELEAEFEAKDKALRVAENACILGLEAEEEYLRQLQAKDDEIEMLKAIIEEAIY